ncbi:MAG TPA: hypothetical protein VFN10_10310 [Thermoanaerobaculia bacterium]|nr:hypothetical protein [Thermoanaerobaculia bacterium]
MKRVSRLLLFALLLLAATTPAFARKARVKIINQSKWEIHHIYLSSTDNDEWGPDQLGEDILEKGHSLTLTGIVCGDYDIKVVDEDGDECVIEDVTLCDKHWWKITDDNLLKCEGYTNN